MILERDSVDQRIAIIRFNRPKKLNAFSVEMTEAFRDVVKTLKHEQEAALRKEKDDLLPVLRGVVITGEGQSFSAGGDRKFLQDRVADSPANNPSIMMDFYNCFMCIRELNVPLYAAINGTAYGAGVGVALLCDIRIVAKDARLSINFSKLGLHAGMGISHYLPKVVNPQVYAYLILTGGEITGEEAEKFGFAFKAVDQSLVLEETLKIARSISARASSHTATFIQTLRAQLDANLHDSLLREAHAQTVCYSTQDMKTALFEGKIFSEDFVHHTLPNPSKKE